MPPRATYTHVYRTGDRNTIALTVDPHPGDEIANQLGRLDKLVTSELLPDIARVARTHGYDMVTDPVELRWAETANGGLHIAATLTPRS